MQLIGYLKCSTCKNAINWLNKNNINFTFREIKEDTPTAEELSDWINKYDIPIKKLFNTSGLKYKELNLKNKLDTMNDIEKIELLSSDGMLIKRPILISATKIFIGFKEKEWGGYFESFNN